MNRKISSLLLFCALNLNLLAQSANDLEVKTENGVVEGISNSGLREFKGVPYAAPPVGDFRWKEPQPKKNWNGVLETKQFAPRAMQLPVFGDMNFRSNGMNEDCLYLNIWTPTTKTSIEKLPVLVYFYGGGFVAGDGSEPRYDGESMARRGIVVVTVNYRLGVFGFLAHPELTKESPHKASGNYALLDQAAAIQWVKRNISAFGGNPNKITIGGESAGSVSVSLQMISPLSKNLIASAIGESGSALRMGLSAIPLDKAEAEGAKFAEKTGAKSIADLRKMSAEELLKVVGASRFSPTIDGYAIPALPEKIFEAGQQAHVPLLVGWNSKEMVPQFLMGKTPLTMDNYVQKINELYGANGQTVLDQYKPANESDLENTAADLASDRFIVFSTWKWADVQARTGVAPVYRYYFARTRPDMRPEMGNAVAGLAGVTKDAAVPKPPKPLGSVHSAEIEYVLGNLPTNRIYDWQAEDYKVSTVSEAYFANFIKTGNPNGLGLPKWEAMKAGQDASTMHIDVDTHPEKEKFRNRYLLLDKLTK